jgi:phasin
MLRFLAKSFWWAASWPLGMGLLALDKFTSEGAKDLEIPLRTSGQGRRQAEQQEAAMSNDPITKPEIPEPLRGMMKMSIEQAKQAFDTFVSTSENAWKSIESNSQAARTSLHALNTKIADITRSNAEANFALVMKLAESKDVQQALELQSEHVRKQMETFTRQLEELRDLTTKIIQEANPAKTDAGTSAGSSSVSRSGYSEA